MCTIDRSIAHVGHVIGIANGNLRARLRLGVRGVFFPAWKFGISCSSLLSLPRRRLDPSEPPGRERPAMAVLPRRPLWTPGGRIHQHRLRSPSLGDILAQALFRPPVSRFLGRWRDRLNPPQPLRWCGDPRWQSGHQFLHCAAGPKAKAGSRCGRGRRCSRFFLPSSSRPRPLPSSPYCRASAMWL